MKNRLTERMEIRLTPRQKKEAVRISKRYDVSIGEVLRLGLSEFIIKERIRK